MSDSVEILVGYACQNIENALSGAHRETSVSWGIAEAWLSRAARIVDAEPPMK